MGSNVNLGSFEVTEATVSRSVSRSSCFFFHMLDWMFTKLGQKHVWVYGYKTYGSKNSPGAIWGHRGKKR